MTGLGTVEASSSCKKVFLQLVQVTKLCGTVVVKVVKVQSLETRVVNKHRGYIVMKITLFFLVASGVPYQDASHVCLMHIPRLQPSTHNPQLSKQSIRPSFHILTCTAPTPACTVLAPIGGRGIQCNFQQIVIVSNICTVHAR